VNVSGDKIEYYSNQKAAEKSSNVSGVINLVNFRGVKKFDNVTFQLDGGSDGVYLLRADSNAELACWLNALEVYLREKQVRVFQWHIVGNLKLLIYNILIYIHTYIHTYMQTHFRYILIIFGEIKDVLMSHMHVSLYIGL
jgi:hypothetical protein